MTETEVPMTTVFTESDFCTELFASFAEQTQSSLPTVSRSWSSDDNNHGACHPYDAGHGPFSPGWYCPAGWQTGSTSTNEASSYLNVYCCPSGYSLDENCLKTTSDVRVYTTDADLSPTFLTFPTAVAEADYFWLQQPLGTAPPPTPEPTGPTESDNETTGESGSSSPYGSGSGGLSTGAKAGIGVGVALAVIIAAVVVLFLWLRKRKGARKNPSVGVTYAGDVMEPSDNLAPEIEDSGKADAEKGVPNSNSAQLGPHIELPATERNVASSVPPGEELEVIQEKQEESSEKTELDSTQRTELGGTQRTELDSIQRAELESQERRQRHELETGMSATVRDVPELMPSAEYYELEGPKNEPSSELESSQTASAPSREHRLSELQQIEAEEERLKKRREELLAAQQQGE